MTEIRLPEARDLFSRELTFPVTCEEVQTELGDVGLQSPTGGDETVGEIFARCESREFGSVDELYGALMTFLSEGYVGRKGYDDRGANIGYDDEVSL